MAEKGTTTPPQSTQDHKNICTQCLSHYTDPKTLPCLHTFCKKCLESLVLVQDDGTFILGCPTCRQPVVLSKESVEGLPTSSLATIHDVKQSKSVDTSAYIVCSRHNKRIQLYCETCEVVVCNMCAIEDHQEHEYNVITRNFSKHREEVATGLEQVRTEMTAFSNVVTKLVSREEKITKQGDDIKEEIQSLAERLVNLIHQSESELLAKVDYIVEQKLKTLSQQKEEVELRLADLRNCCKSLEETLQNNIPQQFLANKKALMERVQESTSVKPILMEPAEKADLKFNGNGALLIKNKELGDIGHTFLHSYCKPVKTEQAKATVGMNAIFKLNITDFDDIPISVPPSLFTCKLTLPETKKSIECVVEEIQPGLYGVNFVPNVDGIHQLSISVGGLEITNSPVTVAVATALNIKGQTLYMVPNLQHPWGVATNENGQIVVVAETASHCLSVLNSDGKKLRTLGSKGKEDGHFTDPRGVAITTNNHILVTDYDRIQKLKMTGHCVRSICGKGSGPLQFKDPKGISVHPKTGKIFIADSNNHRIQVLNADLSFSHSFGNSARVNLCFPWDVACDNQGYVYVIDNENHTVNKFTTEGEFIMKFGSKGSEPGQLNWPSAVAVSPDNNTLYVTDDNNCVSIFDCNGQFVRRIGFDDDTKSGIGFKHPLGITVDGLGKVYISDCWNDRLVIM